RHTRFSRDWSSDVCSSDLVRPELDVGPQGRRDRGDRGGPGRGRGHARRLLLTPVTPHVPGRTSWSRASPPSPSSAPGTWAGASRSEERRGGNELGSEGGVS